MNKLRLLPLLFAFLLAIPCVSFAQDDDEVVKVDSSIVVINAAIADKSGSAVGGLQEKQFRVFEDGVEQEISFFAAESTPFAAVILLDSSGSMQERISLARSAAINFLDGMRAEDFAAIYNFDSKVSLVQDFSNSRDVVEKIFDLKSYGMTVLNDAIYKAAFELGKRPEKRKAIIVLSDGMDTQSGRSADKALKAALAVDAMIYTVDMSALDTGGKERMQSIGVLRNFAEKTGGIFTPTPGGNALREAFKKIVAELGTQYTIAYQPANTKKDGKWRSLELRVARPNLSIRTRKGYNAPKQK